MDIFVLGVGAAYEPNGVNSAILVTESSFSLLVDCGPTVPPALWRQGLSAEEIDAIYITHCHPDHALGLTTLINYCKHKGRKKDLLIIAQSEQWDKLMDLSYFGYWPEASPGFTIHWQDSASCTEIGPWQLDTATSQHSIPNRALLLHGGNGNLFYSGDGRPSADSQALIASADVLFQESESSRPLLSDANHGDWQNCLALPRKTSSLLCPYHIGPEHQAAIRAAAADHSDVHVPQDGSMIQLRDRKWTISSSSVKQ